MIRVFPVNYELKSDLEKEAILNSYQTFLKICDFDIQILIQSRKENLDSYISLIQSQTVQESNEKLIAFSKAYISYIQRKNQVQNSSSKNFYILIYSQVENSLNDFNMKSIRDDLNQKYQIIKDALSRCGNFVCDVNQKKEIESIMNSFYNFRKSLRFTRKEV